MEWFRVGGRGCSRDLWWQVTGDGCPEYGRWTTPAGLDVDGTLGTDGPPGLDVPVWWVQASEHHGKRLTDLLWDTGVTPLQLVSDRMAWRPARGLRRDAGAGRRPGAGAQPASRSPPHSIVVSAEVRQALLDADLVGLEVRTVPGPFPG